MVFKIGLSFLAGVYALFKFLPTRKRYLFITKLSYEKPLDFIVLARALKDKHPDYEVVMLCQPIDNKVKYVFHMFKQFYHLATSEVVFLERSCLAINAFKHKKSLQVIQLWHSLGSMKKFGYAILDTKEGQPTSYAKLFHMHRGYTSILISSYSFLDDFREGFNIDGSSVVEIPLPRVDLFFDKEYATKKRDELFREVPSLKNKKNILYCPTFRKHTSSLVRKKTLELINVVDADAYNFIFCQHPLSDILIDDSRVIVPGNHRSQDMLFVADVVISDYSSIIYEAGLLGLPVYLYAFDWDEYQKSRTHNIDFSRDVPVLFSADAKEIMNAVERNDFNHDAYRVFIDKNVAVPEDGTCCDKIIALIERD